MSRPLKDLQDAIMMIVADDDTLIGLEQIGQDRGDIGAQVDKAVAEAATGIFVVWEVLSGTKNGDGGRQGLKVTATIQEQPTLNRDGGSYLAWDFVLMAVWTLFATSVGNANQPQLIRPESWQVLDDSSGSPKVQIEFSTVAKWERTI